MSAWSTRVYQGYQLAKIAQRGSSAAVLDYSGPVALGEVHDPMPMDRWVLPVVARLWALGLPTIASCDGHWVTDAERMSAGYVGFRLGTHEQWFLMHCILDQWLRDAVTLPAGIDIAVERSGPFWEQHQDGGENRPGARQTLTLLITNHHRDLAIASYYQKTIWQQLARALDVVAIRFR